MTTSTTETDLKPIPNFSRYAITSAGDVFRVEPAERGKTAGLANHRLRPSIHPRGHQWYVQMTDDSGKRHRISVKRLLKDVLGIVDAGAH
jgi:hypothetical protein